MFKKKEMNAEELIEVIERDHEDESSTSNFWEHLYNLELLKELLGTSMVIVGNLAFLHLSDGFYEVKFRIEESPILETVQLFSVEDIVRTSMNSIQEEIDQRQKEILQLEDIKRLLLRG